jgi:hypothetical protein
MPKPTIPGASAPSMPVPEPSDKIDDALSLSALVENLFSVAKLHLSRKDFETLSGAMEIGALILRNTKNVIETIGCDLDSEKPSNLMTHGNLTSMLFHVANSIDAATAMIETASESNYWFNNYDKQRALYAKEGEA